MSRVTYKTEWWKPLLLPGIVVASLGAVGTLMVKGASYITLPEKVSAAEAKNVEQDAELKTLTGIEETWQKVYQAQQAVKEPDSVAEEVADDGEVKEIRWTDKKGKPHHRCCDGTDCWPWHKTTKCAR